MDPKIGVASIIISNEKKILLGLRLGSHGSRTWAPPGGHLDFLESPAECATRETKEETSLDLGNVYPGPWTHDVFSSENKHYITLFMMSACKEGEVKVLEPNKCAKWVWFYWEALPMPLFLPMQSLIKLGHNIVTLQACIKD